MSTTSRSESMSIPAPRSAQRTKQRSNFELYSWLFMRISGIVLVFLVLGHLLIMNVLDTALVRVSPEAYDLVIASYKTPIVNALEVGLVGAVLYHALNGLRVILVDFWSKGPRYQRQMTFAIGAVWVLLMVPGTYFMIKHTVEALLGSTS